MKPRRSLFPFDVCWSHVSNLARILGYFYLKSRIRLSLEASFKKAHKVDELLTNGNPFSPIGGYYGLIVDYGGDHAFGDSFGVGFAQNFNLAIQTRGLGHSGV